MRGVLLFRAPTSELRLVRDVDENFGPSPTGECLGNRVCVGEIQKKLHLSQSADSQYLAQLPQVGLVKAKRCGKWTFYGRNEETVTQVSEFLRMEL